jgi:hypothetical protein
MKTATTLFLLLVTGLFSHLSIALNLSAEVDRDKIALNESLRLIVTADKNIDTEIDFSQLLLQFDIINTRRSSRTAIENGAITSTTNWLLILAPKESGKLIIPSFEAQGAFSKPITITVTEANAASGNDTQSKDIFLEATVDKSSAYVQEQILLTLKLYYKINLASYDANDPNIENTVIEEISENNYRSQLDGEQYNVLEKVYALHPQASGPLTIPSQRWRLEKSSRRFQLGGSSNPYLYTKTPAINIDIKAIPASSTAKSWLPSTAITLDDRWQQSLLQAKVGEPLNYEIVLSANGLSASQLPLIELPETENFTVYSELPKTENNKSAVGIIGTRTTQFAVIPRKAGQFIFPEISFKWWNTSSDREETIRIPAQKIVVANPAVANTNQALPSIPSLAETTATQTTSSNTWLWQISTIILALVCALLGFLLFRQQGQRQPSSQLNSQQKATSLKSNKRLQQLVEAIHNAASEKNAPELRKAIIQWGKFITGNETINSLNAIVEELPELKTELEALDKQLYSQNNENVFSFNALVEKINKIKIKENTNKKNVLEPLY